MSSTTKHSTTTLHEDKGSGTTLQLSGARILQTNAPALIQSRTVDTFSFLRLTVFSYISIPMEVFLHQLRDSITSPFTAIHFALCSLTCLFVLRPLPLSVEPGCTESFTSMAQLEKRGPAVKPSHRVSAQKLFYHYQ